MKNAAKQPSPLGGQTTRHVSTPTAAAPRLPFPPTEPPMWLRMKLARFGANEILSHFGMRTPSVDPFAIARGMGVEVHMVHNPGWAGAVQSDNTGATAWINAGDHPVRRRFTLAHELGHLMLHPTGVMFRDETFAGSPQEAQANNFAADLLMPLWMVQPIAEHVRYDVERLIDIFGVSRQAMQIRLERFGIR